MKEIEELNDLMPPIAIDDNSEKEEIVCASVRKTNEAAAFLQKHPLPAAWMKEMKDKDIKRNFKNNKSIEEIAYLVRLPKETVLLALEEMGLLEPVAI